MCPPKLNSVEPPRYGSVCQVVWEGRCREASPYPDQSWSGRGEDADGDVFDGEAEFDDSDPTAPHVNPFRDVGRNDPCPCGSGKKYKKCCLDSQALHASDE
jgi:SEC-C motif